MVANFEKEMTLGDCDAQIVRYTGVVHDFTNPQAGRNLKSGSAYDADADARAALAVKNFLAEMFEDEAPMAKIPEKKDIVLPKGVPDKVLKVLKQVDDKGTALDGYEGGRTFGNYERLLPQTDKDGKKIRYREWDVNPLKPNVNRGPERMVTGSDGSAWFTADHYRTFIKIR
jgi:guanyl-specific ribonuclease Sa